MAAYAALVSLMNIMDRIQKHRGLSNYLNRKQVESLGKKVEFFLDFIESAHSHAVISEEAQVLESQIASAAYAAEDVIESHVVDLLLVGSTNRSTSYLHLPKVVKDVNTRVIKPIYSMHLKNGLKKVMEEMDSIKKRVIDIKQKRGFEDQQPTYSMPIITSPGKSKMVGFEEDLLHLLERLTGQQLSLQIIPIAGMGGIGKTTLSRNAYEKPLILHHFDVRAWATISQEYSVREIFSKLLSPESKSSGNLSDQETEHELTQKLYQRLIGRRYLVVLDDMWSIETWEKIKFFFPDNNNGSRIVVTTRQSNVVAAHFGPSFLQLKFLDEDKSWELFCQKAFPQEVCPPELEQIGKKIARKCEGLPLLIVVIGALLRKSPWTQEYWENISRDMNSILSTRETEKALDILSLSYSHLSAHLKPCFLYLGFFPEDSDIYVPKLIKLWVAEGFIKPNKTQTLEEVAEGYLKDLVDRNLILVASLRSNGKIKTCNIHDLLRDLCLKKAEKEKFPHVTRVCDIPSGVSKERRIVLHEGSEEYKSRLPLFRALVLPSVGRCPLIKFKLLRVLHLLSIEWSLDDIFKQVNLSYLCLSYSKPIPCELPSSISLLWNLQTLNIGHYGDTFLAPPEIWKMTQLRHLKFHKIRLPDPPSSGRQDDGHIVLKNLQTIKTVVDMKVSEEVCKRIPNIKKLHVYYDNLPWEIETISSSYCFKNLRSSFHKLESLNCYYRGPEIRGDSLQNLTFPISLKKLTLERCRLGWEDLSSDMIGSLPHLQTLNLEADSFTGPEWNPVDGEFLNLKFLRIRSCGDLVRWNAESNHFPVLENLVLDRIMNLDEIPLGVGEIPTLGFIHLMGCNEHASISAVRILEEQENDGNEDLRVRIELWDDAKVEKLREKMEEEFESFNSNNLLIR